VVVAAAGNNFTDGPVRRGLRRGVGRRRDRRRLGGQPRPVRAGLHDLSRRPRGSGSCPATVSAPIPSSGTATFRGDRNPGLARRRLQPRCRQAASTGPGSRWSAAARAPSSSRRPNVVAAGATGMIGYSSDDTFLGTPLVPGIGGPGRLHLAGRRRTDRRPPQDGAGDPALGARSPHCRGSSAGRISGFSSMGLAADLSLKPEIAAPGGSILSTVPLGAGGATTWASGTSMASPHVRRRRRAVPAGASARRPARGRGPPALENSADPVGRAQRRPRARRAAGVRASSTSTTRSRPPRGSRPGTLSLGDDADRRRQTLTVENRGRSTVTYAILGRRRAPRSPAATSCSRSCSRTRPPSRSRSPDGPSARSRFPPAAPPASTSPSHRIRPSRRERSMAATWSSHPTTTNDPPLRVPYAGYKGDYQTVPGADADHPGLPVAGPADRRVDHRPGASALHQAGRERRVHHGARDVRVAYRCRPSRSCCCT